MSGMLGSDMNAQPSAMSARLRSIEFGGNPVAAS
jgi:hypothetical protein